MFNGVKDGVVLKTLFLFILVLVVCVNSNSDISTFSGLNDNGNNELCVPNYSTSQKYCLLRESYYKEPIWSYWAGFYCYYYTDTNRFIEKYSLGLQHFTCSENNISLSLPVMNFSVDSFELFDLNDSNIIEIIGSSFLNQIFFDSFLECWNDAIDCCENHMYNNNSNIMPSWDFCPAIWDGWSCFPQTPVNTTAYLKCSNQAYQSPDSVCELESEKYCLYDPVLNMSYWDQVTNYNVCLMAPVYRERNEYHVFVLYISTFLSLPAIIIFWSFKKFRSDNRIILHRNLLLAICIRNIFTIMSKSIVILDALKGSSESNNVMADNSIGCRFLAALENAAKNAIYATMLVDGFYLHKLIVRTFASDLKLFWLYIVVAVLTIVPTLIWSIVMIINGQENCWMIADDEQWVVDGIRIAILIINALLLLDIIRVLISKMNKRSTSKQTKAAFRATLFLIPLFGLHIAITARPILIDNTCYAEDIYNYVRYSIESFQGIMVSILFCYINTEVHTQFRNAIRKFLIFLEQNYNISFFGFCRTHGNSDNRRYTTATYVHTQDNNHNKY